MFLNINKSSLCACCVQISDYKERFTIRQVPIGEFYKLCTNLNYKKETRDFRPELFTMFRFFAAEQT